MARPPQRHHFVVVVLLFLCVLLLYCHSKISVPVSISTSTSRNPNPAPRLLPSSRPETRTPTSGFTFLIKVLAFNRLDSLSRCLRSLAAADYLSDTVHLHVYIDHFDNRSGDVGSSLDASREILDFVDGFKWEFGDKLVHYRTGNAGLQAQWLEAWWPSSDDEFAFVVEDDLEVSPLFYKFVKSVIWNFYYNATNFSPMIYGVTLQRPRFVPGKHGNKLQVDGRTRVFLYQLVGTWGQILFPKHWKEFRRWYDYHKAKGIKPILEGMVTTGWYRRLGEKIWTPWFIKFIHDRGYFNIYTNFLQERALSVSHRDTGVNYGKTAGPDSHLLNEAPHDFNLLEMQPLSNLKWYDFCFREVVPGRVVKNFNDLGVVLDTVQINETVVFVRLFGFQEVIIRNMLCHFERLNIRNYILMGPMSDLLFDLARRGHPVIDADRFLDSVGANKLKRPENFSPELIKDVMMSTYVIKKCLELRYNAWVVDANVLFPNGGIFWALTESAFDLYTWKSFGAIFVQSSSAVRKLWLNNFVHAVEAGDSLWGKLSISRENSHFADIAASFLESKRVRVKRIDDTSLGVDIGISNLNQASPGVENKVLYWSADAALDKIRKRLEELKMWTLDGDDSCSAVVCRQS